MGILSLSDQSVSGHLIQSSERERTHAVGTQAQFHDVLTYSDAPDLKR
jgi:hypothetical protein